MVLNLDVAILLFINQNLANSLLDKIIPSIQSFPYIFWTLLTIFFLFRKNDRKLALLMITAIVIDLILVVVIKDVIARERPYQILNVRQLIPEEDNRSFPSNHTQLSFLLSTIILRFYRRLGIILFLISILVGLSRIYAGVHYPSDVIAGAVIGILLGLLILKIRHKIIGKST